MFRFYLRLAFKNLFRQKRRTVLTALAIAVGLFYYILFDSLMTGLDRDALKSTLELETGSLQIVAEASEEKYGPSLKHLLPDGSAAARKIAGLPGVQGATPRLIFPVSLISGMDELPVLGVGVEPELDPQVFTVRNFVSEGRWIQSGESSMVLGKNLAELLEIKVGDYLTIRTKTKTQTFQALDLQVAGLIACPNPVINQSQIFLPLDIAQSALGTGNSITLVALKTSSLENLEPVIAQIRQLSFGGPIKIKTWQDLAASFLADMQLHRVFGFVLLFLVAVISVIGVVNSILLSSLERVREIGILKAMGMTEQDMIRLFTYEGISLGLIGGIIGVIGATLTNFYLVNVGIDLASMYGDINIGYPISRMSGAWNWVVMLWSFFFSLLVTLAASYLPARGAARLDPVIGLRKV